MSFLAVVHALGYFGNQVVKIGMIMLGMKGGIHDDSIFRKRGGYLKESFMGCMTAERRHRGAQEGH